MTDQPSAPEDTGSAASTPSSEPQAANKPGFAIVGVGASAGGLEALTQLLEALPGETGMAFVFVQHLDPRHESKLAAILAKSTSMQVHEAKHGMSVEPNNIYIIPPNATITVADEVLQLEARGEGIRHHGAVMVVLDAEEVAAQAARLRGKAGLLDLSSDAIIARDRHGAITLWNHGAELTYGWKAAEAVGEDADALLQPSASDPGTDIEAMLRANSRWQGEMTHVRRDGAPIIVESRQVVQRGPGGEMLAILEINRDVTERRRLMDELAAADKAKSDFLATLGHELRNPLTPLRNGMEVLRMLGGQAPEAAEVRQTMERNIRRMTRLIDDLLDVSRITHGHIELRKENVDMVAVIREVASELRSMAEAAGNRLTTRLPSKPLIVDADPIRLTQIVENVLHNAIKYTDGGRIEVALAAEDGYAVLRVKDSGIGIPQENLARIWEPFVRGDTSLEQRRSGLGLGLTLVRTLVDLHGGIISGMSEGRGKGSEFVIKLPLADGRAEQPASPKASSELKGRRILVVDDNYDAVQSFAALLELMENDVRTAGSGPEALQVAKEYRPEIVLLDIGLPGMNGYDVARELRADLGNDGTVIIAVSGYGAQHDRQRSAAAGFDAHFVKPMGIDALREFLASRQQ